MSAATKKVQPVILEGFSKNVLGEFFPKGATPVVSTKKASRPRVAAPKPKAKAEAKVVVVTSPETPKVKRHQKKTLSRTNVSRRARRIRRAFLATQFEVEFLRDNPKEMTPEELARAEKRLATITAAFNDLPKLAQPLEVAKRVAQAELDGADDDDSDDA